MIRSDYNTNIVDSSNNTNSKTKSKTKSKKNSFFKKINNWIDGGGFFVGIFILVLCILAILVWPITLAYFIYIQGKSGSSGNSHQPYRNIQSSSAPAANLQFAIKPTSAAGTYRCLCGSIQQATHWGGPRNCGNCGKPMHWRQG